MRRSKDAPPRSPEHSREGASNESSDRDSTLVSGTATGESAHMLPDYVTLCGLDYLVAISVSPSHRDALRALGGRRRWWRRREWCFAFRDEAGLAKIMSGLRDFGFAFQAEPEGAPADVFESLRKKGLVAGDFRTVKHGPDGAVVVLER